MENLNTLELSTKALIGKPLHIAKSSKALGKIKRFLFHPNEKRVVGVLVHRPDVALMFHRKDLFVPLGQLDFSSVPVMVTGDINKSAKDTCKSLGLDWQRCLYWAEMPLITKNGHRLGYVQSVLFNATTGDVVSVVCYEGSANAALLGKRVIPEAMILGYKGPDVLEEADGDTQSWNNEGDTWSHGALLVAEEAQTIALQGGAAAKAGKVTAKVSAQADKKLQELKPVAKDAAQKAGKVADQGAYAFGKKLGEASGMFSSFKEEFSKAVKGEDDAS